MTGVLVLCALAAGCAEQVGAHRRESMFFQRLASRRTEHRYRLRQQCVRRARRLPNRRCPTQGKAIPAAWQSPANQAAGAEVVRDAAGHAHHSATRIGGSGDVIAASRQRASDYAARRRSRRPQGPGDPQPSGQGEHSCLAGRERHRSQWTCATRRWTKSSVRSASCATCWCAGRRISSTSLLRPSSARLKRTTCRCGCTT